MAISTGNDRLRALIDVLFASVDDPARGDELARRAYLSRFHFDRLVAAALGESPATFRRRLLLERAAHQLSGGTSVTEVGFEAGYSSPEAFARAFRRAFGVSPSAFAGDFRIAAPNGIHFHPPGGLLLPGDYSRRQPMDLTDRMVEHDSWLTARSDRSSSPLRRCQDASANSARRSSGRVNIATPSSARGHSSRGRSRYNSMPFPSGSRR
jgi:AraC-like DNA-binding protein